ncbi:general transcription factor II-I repeat domain-containing protein 2-like [Palaemon carinicauda]|uniref:general transcription factor II-I repeat domain-containing protein 2-like n=1 Tax=Palaemon carinicauda TaxID=392227 RepID=UPI0035B6456C
MVDAVSVVCPEVISKVEAISLSRRTIVRRIDAIAMNIQDQVLTASVSFQWFSIALDESNDIQDTAQVLIYIRGIDENFEITEELLSMESLKDTVTGKDLYNSVINSLIRSRLSLDKLASITTDGAPSLIVVRAVNLIRARGLNHRQFRSFLEDIEADFTDVLYHTNIQWLSMGKVLKRMWDVKEEVVLFFNMKDISCDFSREMECDEWLKEQNFVHFPLLKTRTVTQALSDKYSYHLTALRDEFIRRFADFKAIEGQFDLLSSPFACDVETVAEELQSFVEFAYIKEELFDDWLKSRQVVTFAVLRRLLLLEEFKKACSRELRIHLEVVKATKVSYAAQLADEYVLPHRSGSGNFNYEMLNNPLPRTSRGGRRGEASSSIPHTPKNNVNPLLFFMW